MSEGNGHAKKALPWIKIFRGDELKLRMEMTGDGHSANLLLRCAAWDCWPDPLPNDAEGATHGPGVPITYSAVGNIRDRRGTEE